MKYLFSFLLLNTIFILPICSQEEIEDDSLWVNYTYQSIEDHWPMGDDTLDRPSILRKSVLRYQNKASAYVKFDVSDSRFIGKQYLLGDGVVVLKNVTNFIDSSGGLVLDNLPVNQHLKIYYISHKGIEILAVLDTYERFSTTDEIDLDEHMFDELSWWFGHPNGQNIFQFVNSQLDWHIIEKLWFIQQFIYYGKALPDNHALVVPSTRDTTIINTGGDCLCRPLRLTKSMEIRPFRGRTAIDNKNGNWNNVWGGDTNRFNGGNGKRWHAFGMRGPAKYKQVWIESPRCTDGQTFKNTIGYDSTRVNGSGNSFLPFTEGNKAIIKYVFGCLNIFDFTPDDCSCERQMGVRISYTYGSQANAEAEILGGGLCKVVNGVARAAAAQAEDLAFLVWTDNADDPESYAIHRSALIGAGVSCNRGIDWGTFTANLIMAGVYAYKALKPAKEPWDPVIAYIYGGKLSEQINKLFTTNLISRTGGCGFRETLGSGMLDNSVNINLNINKTAVAVLQSNSIVHVEGMGRFKANARILSAYGMTGTILSSEPDVAGEVCCRTGSGVYSLAGTPGFPLLTENGLRPWVTARFFEQGIDLVDNINNIDGQFGYRGGGIRPDCLLEITNPPISGLPPNLSEVTSTKITLEQRGNYLYVNNGTESIWELTITDMMGKIVYKNHGESIHNEFISINDLTHSKGLYIVNYVYGFGEKKSLKIINL